MVVAMLVEEFVAELGHEVVAVASHLEAGLELARTGNFDLAVLDLNLGGIQSFPIADALAARGVPFIFASGYGAAGLPSRHRSRAVVQKPFDLDDLNSAIERTVGSATRGADDQRVSADRA
ncbi:MAG: response regulator [Proteobacteria bacterium]|nr:response regulator [Pseudomonadota bacterium]